MSPTYTAHPKLGRRTMLQAGSVGLLGLGMNHVAALRADDTTLRAEGATRPGGGTAKSVIFVFLSGGLTQHDSFDPKPDAPADIRGEFVSIDTRSPGVRVCEHLPLLAARSDRWSLVRSLTTPYNGHSEGHMAILSGRTALPPGFDGSKPQPGDWPSIAAVAGSALAATRGSTSRPTNNLPPAIVLPERLIHRTGRVIPGQFGGLMGSRRDPWFVEASPFNSVSYGAFPDYEFHFERGRERTESLRFEAPNLSLPDGLSASQLGRRDALRTLLDAQRRDLDAAATVAGFDRHRQASIALLTDASVQRAFDVHAVDAATQDRYGRNAFGWSLLMARQLVEAGVGLVQVNLGNNETWDTHDNGFTLLRDCLLPPTDRGLSALLDDLHDRGLLDSTLVVMCGEMGRTPKVQSQNRSPGCGPGRDHWGAVQTVFLAGGGVPGGVIVGQSDKEGGYPAASPQTPENLAATIYHALGIPATAAWIDDVDRPHQIYSGEPIAFG